MFSKRNQSMRHRTHEDSTSKKIKELKLSLMSRSINLQECAVNEILEVLKCKENGADSQLLSANIPEVLCEVMNTHHLTLVRNVFTCLLKWSTDNEFYKHKYSSVVIKTTCRRIIILTREENSKTIIYKGMELLCQILIRCEKEATINLSDIYTVTSTILKSSCYQASHLTAMGLLKFLLQAKDFDHNQLPELINLALTNLLKLKRDNPKKFKKHISYIIQIMTCSMRYLSSHQVEKKLNEKKLNEKTMTVIWNLIKTSVVLYIKELGMSEDDLSIVRKGLKCISYAYNYLDQKRLKYLSNILAAEGYLTLLPALSQHFNIKTIHSYVRSILYHILIRLAKDELELSFSEYELIGKGLMKLPDDSTKWPELLAGGQSECFNLTIVVYLYFVLHCDDSFVKFYVPAIYRYVLGKSSTPPASMLKAISFVFAVSSLPYCKSNNKNEQYQATHKLLQWLKSTSLSKVFTHHPNMLYFWFSEHVNNRVLQLNAMKLWLKNKSTASHKVLQDLVMNLDKAAHRLLHLLIFSDHPLPQASSILKSVLARDKTEESLNTSEYIWKKLPSALSSLTTLGWENRMNNLSCVISLACMVVPHSLDVKLMMRLIEKLVELFQTKCDKTLEEPQNNTKSTDVKLLLSRLFNLTHIIINKMNLLQDYRGLKIFLDEKSLSQACLACIDSVTSVAYPAIRLLVFLQQCQKKHNIQMKNSGTVIDEDFFMKLMSTGGVVRVFLTAELFSTLRTEQKDFICLCTNMSYFTVTTLYSHCLNLSLRQDVVSSLSWKCMTLLLQYCRLYNPEADQGLLNYPLNMLALQAAFNRNSMNDSQFVRYLHTYITGVQLYIGVIHSSHDTDVCRNTRVIRKNLRNFDMSTIPTILTNIAEQLVVKDWPEESLHSQTTKLVYTLREYLPVQIIKKLKTKIANI